jgi:hypothetical protein
MSQRTGSYGRTLLVFCRTAQQASATDEPPSRGSETPADTERVHRLKQRADEQRAIALQERSFATLLKEQMAAVEDR